MPAMNGRRAAIMVRAVRRLAVLLLLLTTGLLERRVVWGIKAEAGMASMATAKRQRGLIILWDRVRETAGEEHEKRIQGKSISSY